MKSNSSDEQINHNLVMFPASRNFKPDLRALEIGPDPLHDLLNEYSHVHEDDFPDCSDDRFETEINSEINNDELDGDVFHSLEAFMNRNSRGESQGPDVSLAKLINDRIEAIMDAKARIKFYLEEIDLFLPSRRR